MLNVNGLVLRFSVPTNTDTDDAQKIEEEVAEEIEGYGVEFKDFIQEKEEEGDTQD